MYAGIIDQITSKKFKLYDRLYKGLRLTDKNIFDSQLYKELWLPLKIEQERQSQTLLNVHSYIKS